VAFNKERHRSNRMPPKATREQRIKWHAAHAVACGCRAVPKASRETLKTANAAPQGNAKRSRMMLTRRQVVGRAVNVVGAIASGMPQP
jgi:hypothetical protein